MITKDRQIFSACAERIRDWQTDEKSYILKNQSLIEILISWYRSNLSDGCWTAGNLLFIRQLARLSPKNISSTMSCNIQISRI